ncbi:MAG: hypothetical protein JXB32_21310 [Deltaproteobacteria bacterium]|nr:hypothetical protein [Deltaproteobacteria bacterium]
MGGLVERIVEVVRAGGPLTGGEIQERVEGESLSLWRACRSSGELSQRVVGRRYLRLDPQVEGYARLSPSILREFLTYTVTGRADDVEGLERRAGEIRERVAGISAAKRGLAERFVEGVCGELEEAWPGEGVCVILAGDIVFGMAHDVPRPERSTGKLVRGSDIDLVVIVADEVSGEVERRLDEAIYRGKYRALIAPAVREEIDYIVKRVSRVREQLGFDTFKRMVACKILREGELLAGSRVMFEGLRGELEALGVGERLVEMERGAEAARREAEERLSGSESSRPGREERILFYSAEESEEFE